MAMPKRAGHQPLMHRVDPQRIAIEQHQTEIGLVPADDRNLQPGRRVGRRGIERLQKRFAAGRQFRRRQAGQRAGD